MRILWALATAFTIAFALRSAAEETGKLTTLAATRESLVFLEGEWPSGTLVQSVPDANIPSVVTQYAEDWARTILAPGILPSESRIPWSGEVRAFAHETPFAYRQEVQYLTFTGKQGEYDFAVAESGSSLSLTIRPVSLPVESAKSEDTVKSLITRFTRVPAGDLSKYRTELSCDAPDPSGETIIAGRLLADVNWQERNWKSSLSFCFHAGRVTLQFTELLEGERGRAMQMSSKGKSIRPGATIKSERFVTPPPEEIRISLTQASEYLRSLQRVSGRPDSDPLEQFRQSLSVLYAEGVTAPLAQRMATISALSLEGIATREQKRECAVMLLQVCEFESDKAARQLLFEKACAILAEVLDRPLPTKSNHGPSDQEKEKYSQLLEPMLKASDDPESEGFVRARDRMGYALKADLIPLAFDSINSPTVPPAVRAELLNQAQCCAAPEAFPYLAEVLVSTEDRLVRRKIALTMEVIVKGKLALKDG